MFLRDARARRIWIYTEPGEYVGAYEMTQGMRGPAAMVLSNDDVPYSLGMVKMLPDDPNRVWVTGMQAHGEDGPYGEPIMAPIDESFVPGIVSNEMGSITQPVPFFAREKWALTPALDVIFGVSHSYRFAVR
ncbi:MAG: hypothetical protein IIA70_07070, partial [Proteobacteria bacterium]|nr:hypothetical protein [Pseudomonadota bacterium]